MIGVLDRSVLSDHKDRYFLVSGGRAIAAMVLTTTHFRPVRLETHALIKQDVSGPTVLVILSLLA
eukprot:10084577-Lingulodinium_polyedra.AAC.1